MPNFKLGIGITDEMARQAKLLSQRRLDYALADFPLTTAALQHRILPNDVLSDLRRLEARGVQELPKYSTLHVALLRDRIPGLRRHLMVQLHMPEPVFAMADTRWAGGGPCPGKAAVPEFEADEQPAVAAWASRVIAAAREKELIDWTVRQALDRLRSSGEILAAWPGLALLARHNREWRQRFRNPPRRLAPYEPKPSFIEQFGKPARAVDLLLTGAELLDEYNHPPKTIKASVAQWEPLLTDRKFA